MKNKLPKFNKEEFLKKFKNFLPFMFTEMLIMTAILVMDLVTKDQLYNLLVVKGEFEIHAIPNFLTITYVENTASGLGIGESIGRVGLCVIMAIAVSIVLGYLTFSHKQSEWLRIPLIFMASGGIGNLVDRVNLGYVRDFFKFEFTFFPYVFNVADVFVTVGAIWLVIYLIVELVLEGKKSKKQFEEEQAANKDKVVEEKKENPESITVQPMGLGDDFLDKSFQETNAIINDINAVEEAKKAGQVSQESNSTDVDKSNDTTDNEAK